MLDLIVMIGICFGSPVVLALLFSGKWKRPKPILWGLAAMVAVLMNIIVVGFAPEVIPPLFFMEGLQWNWVGKVATIATTLVVFSVLPKAVRVETGILNVPKSDNWVIVFSVCTGLLVFFWGASFLMRDGTVPTSEYYVFQAFMPSLDEEFAYRGTILAMLVAAMGKPYSVAGIKVGWGALPVISVFGLVHGYSIVLGGGDINVGLVAFTILLTGIAGAGLYWIKEKTASVWICVVMHSLMNLGSGFFNQFAP